MFERISQAVINNDLNTIKEILSADKTNFDINQRHHISGVTLVCLAAKAGAIEILQYLIDAGAKLSFVNEANSHILFWAAQLPDSDKRQQLSQIFLAHIDKFSDDVTEPIRCTHL